MSAPNPGEEGVRLWRFEWSQPIAVAWSDEAPAKFNYSGARVAEYVALPVAAHEALVARVARLEAAATATLDAIDSTPQAGGEKIGATLYDLRQALASQGGGA